MQSELLADKASKRTQLQDQLMRKLDEELEQVRCCAAATERPFRAFARYTQHTSGKYV